MSQVLTQDRADPVQDLVADPILVQVQVSQVQVVAVRALQHLLRTNHVPLIGMSLKKKKVLSS